MSSSSSFNLKFGGCLGSALGTLITAIALVLSTSVYLEAGDWPSTQGTVVEHEYVDSEVSDGASFARVEYTTPDGIERSVRSKVGGTFIPAVGSEVSVVYLAEDPSQARLLRWELANHAILVVLGFSLLAGAALLFRKARR